MDQRVRYNDDLKAINFQLEAAKTSLDTLLDGDSVILESPTGTGKTEIGLITAAAFMNTHPNQKVLVLTPSELIGNQWKDRIADYTETDITVYHNRPARSYRVGKRFVPALITKDHLFNEADFVISTYQLLKNDIERERLSEDTANQYDLMIVDELEPVVAHDIDFKRLSKYYQTILDHFPNSKLMVLTALPSDKSRFAADALNAQRWQTDPTKTREFMPEIHTSYYRLEDGLIEDLATRLEHRTYSISVDLMKAFKQSPSFPQHIVDRYNRTDLLRLGVLQKLTQQLNAMGEIEVDIDDCFSSISDLTSTLGYLMKTRHGIHRILESPLASLKKILPEYFKPEDCKVFEEEIDERINLGYETSKTACLTEYLSKLERNAAPVIFVNYLETANDLSAILQDMGYHTLCLTSEVSMDTRINFRKRFNNGGKVLIMTYDAGGLGLDLYRATDIIYFGLPRTENKRIQAIGRGMRSANIYENPNKQLNEVVLSYAAAEKSNTDWMKVQQANYDATSVPHCDFEKFSPIANVLSPTERSKFVSGLKLDFNYDEFFIRVKDPRSMTLKIFKNEQY